MEDGKNGDPTADEASDDSALEGIYVTEGMEVTIHGLSLRFSEEGVESTIAGVSLRRDMCGPWLEIAFDHLETAREANADLTEAYESDANIDPPLQREFKSSMQCIVASAVSLDALYAGVKERIELPEDQVSAWQNNGTARWRRMREVFRRGYGIPDAKVSAVGEMLQEIHKFRGWAVHPPADRESPQARPQIDRGVEWRYAAFRYDNACQVLRNTLLFVSSLVRETEADSEALKEYSESLNRLLASLTERWNQTYPDLQG